MVVVGGGAAGTTSALEARRTDRTAEITLINREKLPEYSRCGLRKSENVIIHEEPALRPRVYSNKLLTRFARKAKNKNRILNLNR